MKTYHLRQWSITSNNDPYCAPECATIHLVGYREEGDEHRAITSQVVSVNGREITTLNSMYILENINPEYLRFLQDNKIAYDEDNPIKLVSKRTKIKCPKSFA